jgi:hypothetical protein
VAGAPVALVLAGAALLLGQPAAEPDDLGLRVAQSARAAQALQGPLDGAWTLRERKGRPVLLLQITDPAGGAGPLEASWAEPDGPQGRMDPVAGIERTGRRLTIRLKRAEDGPETVATLRRRGPRAWTGWLTEAGQRRAVSLTQAD